jgi:hypothetical protein
MATYITNVIYPQLQHPQLNPEDVANELITLFYQSITLRGVNSVIHLFDRDAKCTMYGVQHEGSHHLVLKHAENGINRILYDRCNYVWQVLDSNSLMVNVTGICQGVTFANSLTELRHFTDTFVVMHLPHDNNDAPLKITNYISSIL